MPVKESIPLLAYALKKQQEDRIFLQWLQFLPAMAEKRTEYVSFEDYRKRVTGEGIDQRRTEDIIAEIENLHGIKIEY